MIYLLLARTLKDLCIAGLNREKGLRESEEERNREERRTRQTKHWQSEPCPGTAEAPNKARWARGFVARGSQPDPSAAVAVISILHF